MAGGTWIDQNKVRPGVYINYSSSPATLASMGERGVVCIGKQLSWGKGDEFIVIEDPNDCFEKLGYDQLSDELIWLRQLLVGTNRTDGASKLLIWRLGCTGDAAATATQAETVVAAKAGTVVGNLTCEAVTAGAAGNKLSIQIVEDNGHFNVTVLNNGEATTGGTFTGVDNVSDLTDTSLVKFTGSGALSATPDGAAQQFTGGVDAFSGSLTVTANCKGLRGNDISVIVTADPDNNESRCIFYVQTLVDGSLVDSQTLKAEASTVALSGLVDNAWVSFTSTGNAFATSITLTGGADGTVSANAYSDFLAAAELKTWNVIAYGGSDAVVKSAITSFVKRLSNDEGKKVQACLWNYPSADNECVISVAPQHITDLSNHTFTDEEMVCWVAGSTAGASVSQSLTYAAHPDAISINPVLTSSQQIDAINAGQFAFIEEFGSIKNIQDNNTFTTFAPTKGKAFRKNRVIRVIFGLANDIYRVFAQYYVGNTNNDETGRSLLKAEILELLYRYQGNSAVQNVIADDVTVSPGVDSDAVVIECYVQPVDSIEKIYINITIS